MWACVATFNGKRIEKHVVTLDFLLSLQWNIDNKKFAYLDKTGRYNEGIILSIRDSPEAFYKDTEKQNLRCPHNAFSSYPDTTIVIQANFIDLLKKHNMMMLKYNNLEAENYFLKQKFELLSKLLQESDSIPSGSRKFVAI